MTLRLTEEDMRTAIKWCDISPDENDYPAMQRLKEHLEGRLKDRKRALQIRAYLKTKRK